MKIFLAEILIFALMVMSETAPISFSQSPKDGLAVESSKEKTIHIKQIERPEVSVSELNIKIEELNRTILDITSIKQRISGENLDLVKEVQDLKVEIENIFYS